SVPSNLQSANNGLKSETGFSISSKAPKQMGVSKQCRLRLPRTFHESFYISKPPPPAQRKPDPTRKKVSDSQIHIQTTRFAAIFFVDKAHKKDWPYLCPHRQDKTSVCARLGCR